MEAPNKVYLHKIRDEESSGFYKMWFEQRARCVPSEEYIRKDLLLEWAKQQQYNSTTIVADNFWQEVIDKIESI